MLTKEQVTHLAYKQMVDNSPRNIAFDAYNQMYKSGWELPPEIRLLPWIQQVINSDPFDAIQTGIRILASLPPSIQFQPLAPGLDNRERAGIIEKIVKWQLKSANRRRSRTIEHEMAKMSLLYDMCAVKTVDLEYEIQQKQIVNANTKREEQALNMGRIMYVPYDSREVMPIWSNLGLEGVLVVQHRRAQEILDEFGDKARAHPELVKLASEPHDKDWVTYYDYVDHNTRSIWVDEGRTFTTPRASQQARWYIDHGSNPLPFLNWAIKGGTELENDPIHKFQPLLYPVYATGAWDIKNIVQTLGVSEVIAHTGSPRYVEEGPNPQISEVDYGEPERIAKMAPGNTLRALQPAALDQALANVEAMLSAQLDKQTVSAILQGGELPAGVAFATLNLVTQTAIGVLTPAKDLTQKVLAEMFAQTLMWVEFTDKPLYGFETSGDDIGAEMIIRPEELDAKSIYIDVELHPDSPTDQAQKVNTAGIMVGQLGLSQESALSEVGFEDAAAEMKKRMFEDLVRHEFEMELEQERLQMQNGLALELQSAQMKMEFEMQQAMLAAQQGQQQGGPPGGGAPGGLQGGQTLPGQEQALQEQIAAQGPGGSPTGQGVTPPDGGLPPAMFAPEDNAGGAGPAGEVFGNIEEAL
jgi:hypothetical protein